MFRGGANGKVSWTKNPLAPTDPLCTAAILLASPSCGAAAAICCRSHRLQLVSSVDTPRPSRRGPILLGVVHPLSCLGGCSDDDEGGKVALALMRVPQNAHEDKDEVYDSLTLC